MRSRFLTATFSALTEHWRAARVAIRSARARPRRRGLQEPDASLTMLASLLAPKFIVLYAFIASAMYVHYRGRVRHGFFRQLTDHSTLMAPYNALMYLFSAVPNRPYVDVEPLSRPRALTEQLADDPRRGACSSSTRDASAPRRRTTTWASIRSSRRAGSASTSSGTTSRCRRRKRCARRPSSSCSRYPASTRRCSRCCRPAAKLGAHRDPFAGLAALSPRTRHAELTRRCRIIVDGEPYSWRDGEPVMFDETFIHIAENRSDVTRIILFCDVERPLRSRALVSALNHFVRTTLIRASQTENAPGDRVGCAQPHLQRRLSRAADRQGIKRRAASRITR